MDVADDAAGRVEIFSIDGDPHVADPHVDVEAAAGRRVRDGSSPLDRISAALNSRYAAVVIGNVLVVVLILGLALTH
jgi:hypothetical protein